MLIQYLFFQLPAASTIKKTTLSFTFSFRTLSDLIYSNPIKFLKVSSLKQVWNQKKDIKYHSYGPCKHNFRNSLCRNKTKLLARTIVMVAGLSASTSRNPWIRVAAWFPFHLWWIFVA
jgi:hypothetical protein